MKTYPLFDNISDKRLIGFEIENAYLGIGTVTQLLKEIIGVTDVKKRKLFRGSSEIHVEFKYIGHDCIVWEPYGDNSRYWIGPKKDGEHIDNINNIENTFKNYQPPLYRIIIGNIISFRFFKLWKLPV